MDKKLRCPECGHDQFQCNATISATLTTEYDSDGLNYQLLEWDDIENIDNYQCQNCDFYFEGDEEEFLKRLESTSPAVKDEAG